MSATGMEREPVSRLDGGVGVSLGLLAALLYRGTAPAVVNLDGLGYVKLLPYNFAAGHLLYMPLLRACASALSGYGRHAGLMAGRTLGLVAGGLVVVLTFACARALLPRFPSVVAAAGLAVSYGVWVQGSDVEAYAPALCALLSLFLAALAYRARPDRTAALSIGLALSCAVLFHLTHVIVTPFAVAWILAHSPSRRRGIADAALALAVGGGLSLGAYLYATLAVRHLDLSGAIAWVLTAGHGFPYRGGAIQRLGDAAHGLASAFVWAPYLYESDAQTLLGQFLLGLAPVLAAAALIALRARAVGRLPWRLLLVWVVPYAALALGFFGSDHERWIFVLPPIWLAAAAALGSLPRRGPVLAAALIGYLAVANAVTGIGPARHRSWDRTRADAAAARMRDGDLAIFPGHSWDEYIGFYSGTRVVPLPLAYYLGRDGMAGCRARLEREVEGARKRGARIFAVRIFDPDADEDSRGLFELAQLGLPRPALLQLFERYRAVALPTAEPKVTVYRLDDR